MTTSKKKKCLWIAIAVALVFALGGRVAWLLRDAPAAGREAEDEEVEELEFDDAVDAADEEADGGETSEDGEMSEEEGEPDGDGVVVEEDVESEGESDEEERLVDAFDSLTDKWMDESSNGKDVQMKDINTFSAAFRSVPDSRKSECLQRALNLVSDDNVMLLAGILMDKTLDDEYVEAVFNDILNRDEDVKKPILEQIFKDKTHHCWAQVAWIFDATDHASGESASESDATGHASGESASESDATGRLDGDSILESDENTVENYENQGFSDEE